MSRSEPALGAKFAAFGLASLVFLVLLLLVYWVHVRFLPVQVVFYGALLDAVLAALLALAATWALGWLAALNRFERIQTLLVWLLVGYAWAISVPTVIDRSLSFYILEKIQQRGGGVRLDRFEDIFTREYAREHQLVGVRLTEQLASGTVRIEDGCVLLTGRGDRLATFSREFRRHLLPRKRLLMGRYTDELTEDFLQGGNSGSCRPGAPAGPGK